MSAAAVNEVLEQLRARNVVAPNAQAPDTTDEHRPWYVTAMTGAAGWLAGVFLLAFIGISFRIESRVAIGVIGVVLLGSAWSLYFADRRAVFLDQLALALSIAGQMALAWSLLAELNSGLAISATLLAIQLLVLIVMPNRTARSIAALFAIVCWVYLVRFTFDFARDKDAFFAEGFDLAKISLPKQLLCWLLTWAPLVMLSRWLVGRESRWMARPMRVHLRPIVVGLLLALALGGVASEPFVVVIAGVEEIGYGLSAWALFPVLSMALAMYAAYWAFRLRSNGLAGFAAFAALLHLARFYYLYGTSLTWKALIMACLGAALLGAGWFLKRLDPAVKSP